MSRFSAPPDVLDLPPTVLDVWAAEVSGRDEARAVLQALLGLYLGQDRARVATGPPVRVVIGPHGKPALAGDAPPLHFNMSHTTGLALYALACDQEVGIDVERPRPGLDTVRLARRFITREEADALAALRPADRDAAFLRAWVRHEATVKCLGTGIGGVDLSTLAETARPWVRELELEGLGAAAVAARRAPTALRCWRWESR